VVLLAWFLAAAPGSALAATPKVSSPGKPEWQGPLTLQSQDGSASLSWNADKGIAPELFRLSEKVNGETRVSYVTGNTLDLHRASPGLYRFSLEGCLRKPDQLPVCGTRSKELSLTITDEIYQPYIQPKPEALVATSAQSEARMGPSEFRPGRWFNPDKSGIGWSMYWSNRLELSQNPSNVFDLQVIWYTYEAKKILAYCDGPNDTCPPLVTEYLDYRPVVASMNLVKHQSNNTYVGAITIRRKGVFQNVGSATLTMGETATKASIQWAADFKKESLVGRDDIMLLAGGDGSSANDASSATGLYGDSNGNAFVAADIGSISQVMGAVFYDNNADPTWIMAHKYVPNVPPVFGNTDLCFYYTPGGYPPNQIQPGLLSPMYSSCDPENATSSSRNGLRAFSGAETGQFWINFTLPPGQTGDNAAAGGSLSLGSSTSPVTLSKATNRSRIWFSGANACEISSSSPTCTTALTWFTGSDYPNASVWIHNQTTGQRSLLESEVAPATENRQVSLISAGSYRFELYQGNNTSSVLLASSNLYTVSQALGAPMAPSGLMASWTNEATQTFRLEWTHANTATVSYYRLTEVAPGGDVSVFTVSPGTLMSRSFTKSSGPWGSYSYRVMACNSDNQCSPDTTSVQWVLNDPNTVPAGTIQQPWKTNEFGNLHTNLGYQYALGYHFTPSVNGQVTQLGGYFNGSKQVKLFRRSNGALLATASVSTSNSWKFVNITPVALSAGEQYTVAAYLAGSGASARSAVNFPQTFGDITILASTYASTASNPDAVPNLEQSTVSMYGQVDISFVGDSVTPPQAPVISTIPAQQHAEGTSVNLQVNATDPDGTVVGFSAISLPAGLSINQAGLISGTIAVGAASASPYNVTITAVDNTGLTAQQSFIWTVSAPPGTGPGVVFSDSFEISQWNNLWTQDSQNDWFRSTQRATDGTWSAEVDGFASNAQLISIPINLQGSSTATIEFDWFIESSLDAGEYLAFDVSTDGGSNWIEKKRLRGDVDVENVWHHEQFQLTGLSALRLRFRGFMSGSEEDANVDNVKVTVASAPVNTAPVVTHPGNQTNVTGASISPLHLVVTDAENDPVTCAITGLPSGLSESAECVISGTISASAGSYSVGIVANDGKVNSDGVTFTWTVTSSTRAANPETPPAPAPVPNFAASASSSRVGATPGSFRVSESGHATYSIPIAVAAGSGGMSPQISLEYSSEAGNGPVGLGWSLGGQSAISRCSQTLEQDGPSAIRGITLTASDRFCLDGQRLMLVSGSYGAAGSEYRGEIDHFAKVVANGVAGNGPASFTVWRKDGSVAEYGNSNDSRIEARAVDNTTALLWALNKISDSSGNYLNYSYLEAGASLGDPVEFLLQKIAYTGNTRAGTVPFAELDFLYDTSRGDAQVSYLAGAELVQTQRLVRIDSKARVDAGSAMQFLRSYFLTYQMDPQGRSLLGSIKECRDSSQNYCFQPTGFDWQLADNAINKSKSGNFSFPKVLHGLALGDSNGDGLPDLFYTEKAGSNYLLKAALAQPNGEFIISSGRTGLPKDENSEPVKITVIDLNADGRQDLIYAYDAGAGPKWYAQISGSSTTFAVLAPAASDKLSLLKVMDFDGDGLPDLLYGYKPGSGPGQQLVWQRNTFTPGGAAGLAPAQDLNADMADLFPNNVPDDNPANSENWFINDEHPNFAAEADPVRSQVFDYNGDGAVDLLVKVSRQYCQGQCGFESISQASSPGLFSLSNLSSDPFAAPKREQPEAKTVGTGTKTATASFWVIYESNGANGFRFREVVAQDADCTLIEVCRTYAALPVIRDPHPVDINADGLADLLYRNQAGVWEFRLNTGKQFVEGMTISGQLSTAIHHAAQLQDMNGDGWPDLVYPSAAEDPNAKWAVHFNQLGLAFGAAQLIAAPAGNSLDKDFGVFADFTGDGKLDHLFVNLNSLGTVQSTELRLGGNTLAGEPNAAAPASVIRTFTDGFGASTALSYHPLTDTAVYSRMWDSSKAAWGNGSAVYDFVAPVYIVSQVESLAPTYASASATSRVEYHYVGAKLQAGGRGFLGFGEVISFDPQSSIRTNTRYRQDFPFIGLPADTTQAKVSSSQKFHSISNTSATTPVSWGAVGATNSAVALPSGTRLSYAINQWETRETQIGKSSWFPYVANSLERAYTLAGGFNRKVLTTQTYNNNYGNLDTVVVRTYAADGSTAIATQTTSNSYADNISLWHLGRLTSSQVTHARNGKSSIVRNSVFAYDSKTGILNRETIEPGSAQFEVVTSYQLDLFGNRISTAVKGYGMPERLGTQSYDSLGRYVIETRNSFNQVSSKVTQRDVFGNPLQLENIDGVKTLTGVDHMGRAFISWTVTGAWHKTLMNLGSGSYCPAGRTAFHSVSIGGGQPIQYLCSDKLGREIRTVREGFSGKFIHADTEYDENGRVARVSEPYFRNDTVSWNETAYDALGRISDVQAVDGNDLNYDYDESASACGNSGGAGQIRITNALGQVQLEIRSALGETTSVYDHACGLVTYDYDSVGNLVELVGANGVVTSIVYDKAGRKTRLSDVDKGTWQYAYNPLGEMTRQIDSKAQALDFVFDVLGRVTVRYERTGVSSLSDDSFTTVNSESTTWINSTSSSEKGKGQISLVTYRAGSSGAVVQQTVHSYDGYGRTILRSNSVDGLVLADETSYDQYGRVFQQFDASGDYRGVRYHYNSRGYPERLQEAREGDQGEIYQRVLDQDERGNVTAMELGNGVKAFASYNPVSGRLVSLEAYDKHLVELQSVIYGFDVLGNLLSRHDTSRTQNLKETFAYDELNRLEQVLLANGSAQAQLTLSLQYDESGNITHKSDVGDYLYGQNGAGAHAVTTAGKTTYNYDLNGNQITSSDGRTISYTLFDQATRIQKASESTEFFYGIANQRIKRVDNNTIDSAKTTWYFDSVERIQYHGENVFFRRSVGGIAVVDYFPTTGASSISYLIKDHLGSIHTVTDQSGVVSNSTSMHFGAFGERQSESWNSAISQSGSRLQNMVNTRGFTGHEHVDGLGIIHMNGRIYDPRLGRMLQADPFVQSPKNSQSLNRYTYVLNNPLSYTDPTGYFSFSRFIKKWGRVIVAAVAAYFTWGAASGWAASFAWGSTMGTTATLTVTGGVVAGAISGAMGGVILTGTLKGGIQGAFSGAIMGGVVGHFGDSYSAKRIAADSLAGGVSSEIYGQRFKDGLLVGALIASATFITVKLRAYQKAQSELFPGQVGESAGFRGVDGKLAGERVFEEIWIESGAAYEYAQGKSLDWVIENKYLPFKNKVSPLGGLQGGEGLLFGQPYPPEGLINHVLEGFSGVHDTLNQPFFYTPNGTNRLLTGFWQKSIGYLLNPVNVLLASPIAIPALFPDYMRHIYYPVQEL